MAGGAAHPGRGAVSDDYGDYSSASPTGGPLAMAPMGENTRASRRVTEKRREAASLVDQRAEAVLRENTFALASQLPSAPITNPLQIL